MAVTYPHLPTITALNQYDEDARDTYNPLVSQNSEVKTVLTTQIREIANHLLPPGAYDTHVHVFDPRLAPYSPKRAYTPGNAYFEDLLRFSENISTSSLPANFVIVQPSPYRTDNSALLSVLRQCQKNGRFVRGIAVVDLDTVTNVELTAMNDLGIRGLRLNLQSDGNDVDLAATEAQLKRAANKIRHLPGWKLQIFAPAHVWEDLYSTICDLPVVIIADHCGGLLAPSKLSDGFKQYPTTQRGFQSLVSLARQFRVLVKISGLYRSSAETATNFADMAPLIQALARDVPDSLVWGSDWPHTGEGKDRLGKKDLNIIEPFRVIDNAAILRNIRQWMGGQENWLKMMVSNPRRVYE